MTNTENDKDVIDRLKANGFEKIVGEFEYDDWEHHTRINWTPKVPNDYEHDDYLADNLEIYVFDLLDAWEDTNDWDRTYGTVTVDVVKRTFDFDLEGERTEEVSARFVVEENEPEPGVKLLDALRARFEATKTEGSANG